ncbi:unnamed protein product [Rotaria sordida]|uniref:FLYWCH-type domain-containing protein n=1 Tax=Rotaria sordida TaxID=392033 RepID=A0A815JG29_9BILA|nr:unnamed protein product [Rotaria sordida]CAF1615861.1 unnamed protein product [Rotaria sordida]
MTDSTILSFTASNRGKPMLIYSGYVYRLKKSTKKVKYWVCQSNSCAVNVHTNANDQFIKANGRHQHLPAPERIELRDLKHTVKERVENETTSVPKIYEEELARSNLSAAALIIAPLAADAKSVLNRVRRNITPPIPTSSDFDIPDFYRQTLNDLPCVISLLSGKSTDIYIQLLSELEYHAERLNMKFEPRHVMSDFEMSLIKAIK